MNRLIRVAAFALLPAISLSLAAQGTSGESYVSLLEKLAATVQADKGDCTKMSTDLDAFLKAHKDEIAADKKAGASRTPEERREFMEKYGARLRAAQMKLRDGLGSCATDPRIKAAVEAFSQRPKA